MPDMIPVYDMQIWVVFHILSLSLEELWGLFPDHIEKVMCGLIDGENLLSLQPRLALIISL